MKIPKITSRYCPYCRKHTEQKISIVSSGHKRGSLKRGGKARVRMRGGWRGKGNHGKYSKPPIAKWKMKTKTTKKTNLKYACSECKKSTTQKKGRRVGKVVIEEQTK